MNNFTLTARVYDSEDDLSNLRIRSQGTLEEECLPRLVLGILNCLLQDDPELEQFIAQGLCLYVEEREKEHGINKE